MRTPNTKPPKPNTVSLGQHSKHEIDLLMPLIHKIDVLRPMTAMISDKDLKNKHLEFKERLANGETLDDLLVDAFAVVREATNRVRHTPHYLEQLMGGIILHQGRVAEMRTGEGKTQTCLLPAYLNALEGKGVHVVTCNDYLAARDAEEMAVVHNALGLTVGCVTKDTPQEERKAQYACDITYVTNNELAFDYLRDNMAIYKEEQVLRDLHYCIIDEVDSVLIDEARMPLRISGRNDQDLSLYEPANRFVLDLERGEPPEERTKIEYILDGAAEETGDFVAIEKDNIINLTSQGVEKAEKFFGVENLADPENLEIIHHINLALRANYLLERDVDYMVKDGEVLIIDEFTGRATPGRKYSDGLHQAIEAKEGLKINQESITIASVTFQNFFNKYKKKGGMTGTGRTEEREFRDVYFMDVVTVPTHRPIQRIDYPDAVYKSHKEKINAVVDEIKEAHDKGQPVLVGTVSVEGSEEISERLKKEKIPHNVLNAKLLDLEAEIVSHAGEYGSVTIATNMAGRGTDIKIDEKARAAGGLKVIGTERHESRRIDDQLRGRSGRQGDVGESQFIVSLDDEILRHFGSERMIAIYTALGFKEGERLQHKSLHHTIERAQGKVEFNHYGMRKNVLEYDKVLNEQREIIYEERERILTEENIHPSICRLIEHTILDAVDMVVGEDTKPKQWDFGELNSLILPLIPIKPMSLARLEGDDRRALEIQLKLEALNLYEDKIGEFGHTYNVDEIEKVVLLKCIDSKWTRHIEDMDQLKKGINLQNYSGKDPLTAYKFMAYDMFDEMIRGIREDAIYILYRARFGREAKREHVARIVDQIESGIKEDLKNREGEGGIEKKDQRSRAEILNVALPKPEELSEEVSEETPEELSQETAEELSAVESRETVDGESLEAGQSVQKEKTPEDIAKLITSRVMGLNKSVANENKEAAKSMGVVEIAGENRVAMGIETDDPIDDIIKPAGKSNTEINTKPASKTASEPTSKHASKLDPDTSVRIEDEYAEAHERVVVIKRELKDNYDDDDDFR
ncbi:MAG: preprotein translocase subunit SecA [Lachnospiraceae bacterium]|nr:preprotein translocase subunit SecA [Lachnospiraceae bacterium]